MHRVSRYDATGLLDMWVTFTGYVGEGDLPRLNEGRYNHGCGAYLRQVSRGCLSLCVH